MDLLLGATVQRMHSRSGNAAYSDLGAGCILLLRLASELYR